MTRTKSKARARPAAPARSSPANPRPDEDAADSGRRTRLNPHERERQIVQGAVNFFAEVGFSGQTRELAKRLGVTQGLLYRYFPSKEALLDRVYQEVFEAKWNPHWDEWLEDQEQPLRERLIRFYADYARVIHTYEWVRIFLLSGMAGLDINQRYLRLVRKRIYPKIIKMLRQEFHLPPREDGVLSRQEEDLMLNLHGMVFFIGIRKWIYGFDLQGSTQELVSQQIDLVLYGARAILAETP
jgi:AcrR family transcriptional regulator